MSSRPRALAAFALTAAALIGLGGCATRAAPSSSPEAAPNVAVPVRHRQPYARPGRRLPQTRRPTTRP